MTDVPPDNGDATREPAAPQDPPVIRRSNFEPPPPGSPPLSFDDDALAEVMAAEVRPYTQPISLPRAPVMPEPVVPEPVLPESVVPESVVPDTVLPEPPVPASAPEAPSPTLEAIEQLEEKLRLISSGEAPSPPQPPSEAAPREHDPFSGGPFPGEASEPEPALDHPAPGHFFPAAFEPIAPPEVGPAPMPPAESAQEAPAEPPSRIPGLFDVDESLIDPSAVAELNLPAPSAPSSETPWWAVTPPVDGAWDLAGAAPSGEPEPAPAPAPPAPAPAPELQSEPEPAPAPAASFTAAVPISTEPPVGPEAPDWLDAPPPSFDIPDLVEPPVAVDPPAEAEADEPAPVEPPEPISQVAMAKLPLPLPTEQPRLEERAELPPPPGYEDIPIMSGDTPMPSVPMFPLLPAAPLVPLPSTSPDDGAPRATDPPALDHDEDDVIDEVDRVAGTGAIPVSAVGTVEPLSPPSEPIATGRIADDEPALVDKKPQSPSAFEVETAGPEPTARDLRAGRAARLFWLWFAANSSVLSLGLGAVLLGTGMSLRQAIVATLAGVAISFLPLGLGTLAGKWSGQPTMIVSRATFGHAGNILPALLAVATRVLWGGVLLWLLATAVAQVLVGAGLDAGLGTMVWQLVGLVAGFVIATIVAVFGYGLVAKLQLVLSILSAILIVGAAVLSYGHLDFSTALTIPDGSWILVISGAALVFSVVGLAWVHSSSDLARYQRPASSGGSSMLWATFGATLPPFALISWGAMLAASDPALAKGLTSNPLAAIASLLPAWYPAPLLAAAALGLLSGAVLTMYSGGFALQALGVRVRRSFATFVSALLVLAAAAALLFVVTDLGSLLRDIVITVAVPVATWAGIFAAEMMIRTRHFHTPSLLKPGGVYRQVRWLNFVALIAISAVGLGLVTSQIPGLQWEGFLYGVLGIGPHDLVASSDAGVFVALLLGILVPLVGGVPAIRRQERTVLAD
jgi:purine-cytosine permease-like protein